MPKLLVLLFIMQLANPWFVLRSGSVPQDLRQHLRRFEVSSLSVMEYRKGHVVFLLAARSNANFEFLLKIRPCCKRCIMDSYWTRASTLWTRFGN